MTARIELTTAAGSSSVEKLKKTRAKARNTIPEAMADVALVDATNAGAVGSMSVSWWLEEVRAKRAPAPVTRGTRCTRWRLSDVREFWAAFAERRASDTTTADALLARATKASHKARSSRLQAGSPKPKSTVGGAS